MRTNGALLAFAVALGATAAQANERPVSRELYDLGPLAFEPRDAGKGAPVEFVARGRGYGILLSPGDVNLELHGRGGEASIRMRLVGANRSSAGEALDPLPGIRNSLRGNDPAAWRRNVRAFGRVRYRNAYPGIDVVHYGNQRQLEFDLVVRPGGDPSRVQLAFDGADAMAIDPDGDVVLSKDGGALHVRKPLVYQEVDGKRQAVAGAYVKTGNRQVRFQVARYDASRPLVIDPVVQYATYLGGSSEDGAVGVAVDSNGDTYLTGWTASTDFPQGGLPATIPPKGTPGPIGPRDVFVAKFNTSKAGSASLGYVTVLGGSGDDRARGIAVGTEPDGSFAVYVTGETGSDDFPTTPGSFQPLNTGSVSKGFVLKLDASGSGLAYSTYLGGDNSQDAGDAIGVDASGAAYVMGWTSSPLFPSSSGVAVPAPPSTFMDAQNAGSCSPGYSFVAKLNPTGSQIPAWTYLPGCGYAGGRTLAVTATHVAVVYAKNGAAGQTNGLRGMEVALFDHGLVSQGMGWSQPTGGDDVPTALDVDQAGGVWVAGFNDLPPGQSWLIRQGWGSYAPGPLWARPKALKVDTRPTGSDVYVAWGNLIEKYPPAFDLSFPIRIDGVNALAVDSLGNVFAAGATSDDNNAFDPSFVLFPNPTVEANAFDPTCGTASDECESLADAFLVRLSENRLPVAVAGADQVVSADPVACLAWVTVDGNGSYDLDGHTLTYVWSVPTLGSNVPTPALTTLYPAGVHPLTLIVDDGHAGTASDTVVVQVNDVTPPVFSSVPAAILVPQNVAVSLGTPIATDTCVGPVNMTSDAPAAFPLGTTLVTFTATDAAGNSAAATTTVTVTAVPIASATGAGSVTFAASAGSFGSLAAIAESAMPAAGKPTGVTFPFGFFSWTVTNLTPGQSTTITITYPTNVATGAVYWKVINGNWVDATSLLGGDDGDAVLTLTITDGGPGDADGVANGQISDPGAVGFTTPDATLAGRMHGAGHIDEHGRRHQFEFRARERNDGNERGSLRYEGHERARPRRSGRFVSTAVAEVVFSDDPAGRPGRRALPAVDSVEFSGTGRWNGVAGYSFRARAADVGEPGRRRDTFTLTVSDRNGAVVASVGGELDGGNIQSSRVKR